MNARRLAIHSFIAVAAVAFAYAVAVRSTAKHTEAERPLVYDIIEGELRQVEFARSGATLTLEPRLDERRERYAWVTLAPEGKRPVSFRGNRHAAHVLQAYLPLRAVRTLGILSPVQLREGGLEGSDETVTIRTGSGERHLVLGSATVAGEGRRALAPHSGQVFILADDLLPSPERAVREMFDPALHAFASDEITRMAIQALDRTREALSHPNQEPTTLWSWKEDPEHPSQELTSWAEHVERMGGRGPLLSDDPGDPVLTVTYFHAEQPRGFLKLWPCAHEERWVRCAGMTERTVGLVEMSPVAEQIINDAHRMIGVGGGSEHARALK